MALLFSVAIAYMCITVNDNTDVFEVKVAVRKTLFDEVKWFAKKNEMWCTSAMRENFTHVMKSVWNFALMLLRKMRLLRSYFEDSFLLLPQSFTDRVFIWATVYVSADSIQCAKSIALGSISTAAEKDATKTDHVSSLVCTMCVCDVSYQKRLLGYFSHQL